MSSTGQSEPSRTLVTFYSMTGNTRRVAREIQTALAAEFEELVELKPRRGFVGVLRALFDTVARRGATLAPTRHDPGERDLLILGGPIWGGRMASPVRAYAMGAARHAPRVAFFCTMGSKGAATAFADLEALCGRTPVATFAADAAQLNKGTYRAALAGFVASLKLAPADLRSEQAA
jgi:flavodoxin